ncbi:hypothetical protein A9Q81_18545 [Gammaproteobacteria bacterium 42_54_T18]|nr:hypothetical protein A9Q81_18545 [Gammaproteobacteria bacterium 42_54_T18]
MTKELPPIKHATLVFCDQTLGTSLGLSTDLYALLHFFAKKTDKEFCYDNVAVTGNSITTSGRLSVSFEKSIEDIDKTDLVMLPAFWGDPLQVLKENEALIPWLIQQYQHGALLVAHSTSAFFLAQTGLLNNRSATTHWHYFEQFEKMFPAVQLCRQRFITASDRLYCSSGLSSAMDLGVYLVEQLWGVDIANQINQNFLIDLKRNYKPEFINVEGHKFHDDELILSIQSWLELNYSKNTGLDEISLRFNTSVSSLKRRFKQATGETPNKYIQNLRIERAKELLKFDDLSINLIAYEVGYEDVSYFGSLFKRLVGSTPNLYRKSFRGE